MPRMPLIKPIIQVIFLGAEGAFIVTVFLRWMDGKKKEVVSKALILCQVEPVETLLFNVLKHFDELNVIFASFLGAFEITSDLMICVERDRIYRIVSLC